MSDSNEENVTFGTPLDPLEEDEIPRKKPITIQDQIATDEQGRRRFHGAFTGGFSAGYFNTVGSRDGWKPQQFKSSRSNKSKAFAQRPEDYMDEEDTGEFGIAPITIRPMQEFQNQDKPSLKRSRTPQSGEGPIPGTPVLQDFLVLSRERIGVRLLKKMGWKPGQGVGPRVTKREKSKLSKQNQKFRMTEDEKTASDLESSDDEFAGVKFAPNDCELEMPLPKDDYFGIDYVGLDKRPVLSQHINLFEAPTFRLQEKNKKLSIRGQAFGVGAFETSDGDIYSNEDMSQYDFSLGPEKHKKSRWSGDKKSVTSGGCIQGFVPSKKPYQLTILYSAPALPKDFKPFHVIRKSRFEPESQNPETSMKEKPTLNAETRGKMLSEEAGKIPGKSVASNIIIRSLNLNGEPEPETTPKIPSWMEKLKTSRFVRAEAATSSSDPKPGEDKKADNFAKPFTDPKKQKRFEVYLKTGEYEYELSMTLWEVEQERGEFEKLKLLQKNAKPETGVSGEIEITESVPDDPIIKAAKLKMFGTLTREKTPWQPSSVVCKRFNVPEPKTGCAREDHKNKQKVSLFGSMDWGVSKFQKASEVLAEKEENAGKEENLEIVQETLPRASTSAEIEEIGDEAEVEKEEKGNEECHENLQDKKDLFKAIFLSSSEDSDSEPEENLDIDVVKSVLIGQPLAEVNVLRNNSPPRGIFAKLDLESLSMPVAKNTSKSCDEENKDEDIEVPVVYGPVLPRILDGPSNPGAENSTSRSVLPSFVASKLESYSGKWVEKEKSKKSKKEKKKHKHKEKSKHKKHSKKHKR